MVDSALHVQLAIERQSLSESDPGRMKEGFAHYQTSDLFRKVVESASAVAAAHQGAKLVLSHNACQMMQGRTLFTSLICQPTTPTQTLATAFAAAPFISKTMGCTTHHAQTRQAWKRLIR
jgi:hypothetical protein